MLVSLDTVSEAIVHVMRMNDYAVDVTQDAGIYRAIATHPDGGTHSAEDLGFWVQDVKHGESGRDHGIEAGVHRRPAGEWRAGAPADPPGRPARRAGAGLDSPPPALAAAALPAVAFRAGRLLDVRLLAMAVIYAGPSPRAKAADAAVTAEPCLGPRPRGCAGRMALVRLKSSRPG